MFIKIHNSSLASTYEIRCLLGTLFALVVADGLLSNFLVVNNLAWEWNPLLRPLIGGNSLLLLKMAGASLVVFILWDIYKRRPKLATISTLCCVIAYTWILYWNLTAFFIAQA